MLTIFSVYSILGAIIAITYGSWLLLARRSLKVVTSVGIMFILLGSGNLVDFLYRTSSSPQMALFYVKLYSTIGAFGVLSLFEGARRLPLIPTSRWLGVFSLLQIGLVAMVWTTNWVQSGVSKTTVGWVLTKPGLMYSIVAVYTYLLALISLMMFFAYFRAQTNQRIRHAVKWFLYGAFLYMIASFVYYVLPIVVSLPDPAPLLSIIFVGLSAYGFRNLNQDRLVKVALSQTLLDVSPELILVVSTEGEILYFNRTAAKYLPGLREATNVKDSKVFSGKFTLGEPRQEVKIQGKTLQIEQTSLTDKWGQPGYLLIGRDITETKKLLQRLEKLSITDPLTGLYNRRYLLIKLDQEIVVAKRYNTNFLVFMIDMDDFKKINDEMGHQAGDYVLQKVGQILKSQLREKDIVARYGGDEFAGILKLPDLDKGSRILSRILKTLIETPFYWKNQRINVGFSAGLTAFKCSHGNVESLLSLADKALYEAKLSGKGKIKTLCPGK